MAEPAVKELASQHQNIVIRWRSFELRPEPSATLDPKGDYLVSAWKNHVYPLTANMNMLLKQPLIQPRSKRAHEAAKWPEKYNNFKKYHVALFRAFFELGKDIGDIKILTELASDLNLDAGALLYASLKNKDYTAIVLADEDEAKRVGVRAVPAFVVN